MDNITLKYRHDELLPLALMLELSAKELISAKDKEMELRGHVIKSTSLRLKQMLIHEKDKYTINLKPFEAIAIYLAITDKWLIANTQWNAMVVNNTLHKLDQQLS